MTSYFSENEAENLQNGDFLFGQIPDFVLRYLENHGALRSVRAHFFALFALFHLSSTYFLSGVAL